MRPLYYTKTHDNSQQKNAKNLTNKKSDKYRINLDFKPLFFIGFCQIPVLFKKYSKEELLIGLINFYYPNQKYLNDKMEAFRDNKINISDFRIIIKFIYKYAKNNELYIVKFILLYFKCFKCYIINQNRGIYGKNKNALRHSHD